MERHGWWVYPWQVDSIVKSWAHAYPKRVTLAHAEQYTRHFCWAVTVTDPAVPAEEKRRALFMVPHAHEPAGTAGIMSFIQQLLTGRHADGTPSTLRAGEMLRQAELTFIPDGNPYGRSRCPVPVWEGDRYNNREFINMVFGIGALSSQEPLKPRWERFKRVDAFSVGDNPPDRIGLVYEKVDANTYVEPNRGDPRSALVRLVGRLTAEQTFDMALGLHQTEFQGRTEGENCMVIMPGLQAELDPDLQARNQSLADAITDVWRTVGGAPQRHQTGRAEVSRFQRQATRVPWEALQRGGAFLTLEVMNNNPAVPAEQQQLLFDAAIWRSIAHMLDQ